MKRYDMDNTACPFEDSCGAWVNADVAQELYDALEEAQRLLWKEGYTTSNQAVWKGMQALNKADE